MLGLVPNDHLKSLVNKGCVNKMGMRKVMVNIEFYLGEGQEKCPLWVALTILMSVSFMGGSDNINVTLNEC